MAAAFQYSKKTGRCVGCQPSICLMQAVGVIICHTQLWLAWTDLVCISLCRVLCCLSLLPSFFVFLCDKIASMRMDHVSHPAGTEPSSSEIPQQLLGPLASVQCCGPLFRVLYKTCAVCTQPKGTPVPQEAWCHLALLCSWRPHQRKCKE